MDFSLPNNADYMLCVLYREYQNRINAGEPMDEALLFGDADLIHETLIPKWSPADITTIAGWLCDYGFLAAAYADTLLDAAVLTPSAISYMETRFKRKASALLDTITKLRSILFP